MILPRRHGLAVLLLALLAPAALPGQTHEVSLDPASWLATDSARSLHYLDRSALYIDRGVALARGVSMVNGALEVDVAASDTTNFIGIVFRAASPRFSNVIFLRFGASGTEEAVQYGPAFNSVGVAWQVYHGPGANAAIDLERRRWIHLRVVLRGPEASFYVDSVATPILVVPRVVGSGGAGIGVWAGAFGRGAYFSNIRYTPATDSTAVEAAPILPLGTIDRWQLSGAIEAAAFSPDRLPALDRMSWQPVRPEPEGFVLVNRYREAPVGGVPRDSAGVVLVDSVMTGKFAGARIVYARTTIVAARDQLQRLQYGYSNGVVIYLNGRPLVMALNPGGLRSNLGVMAHVGDAVFLPLKRGRNDLVFAVIQATGGWAYSARLDPVTP